MTVAIIEYRPEPEEFGWTFGGLEPVRRVAPGDVLRLWTEDAFGGHLRSTSSRLSTDVPGLLTNPQTGPFHVEGARPGDTLVLHVLDLRPARTWGASCAFPGFGGLTSTDLDPSLQDLLPERVWMYDVDAEAGTVTYRALDSDHQMALPLEPMLGTIGVAPARGEVRSSLVPDRHGGNLDVPAVRPGTTVYLGVNVEGALFSVGDGHYRQGEGELCGSGVEGALWVDLVVDLLPGVPTAGPRLETDDSLIAVGSARPLDAAWRIAHLDLVRWVADRTGLSPMDAYQLVSQVGRSPIGNVVDPNFTVTAVVDKKYLPGMDEAADGLHQRLRATDLPARP